MQAVLFLGCLHATKSGFLMSTYKIFFHFSIKIFVVATQINMWNCSFGHIMQKCIECKFRKLVQFKFTNLPIWTYKTWNFHFRKRESIALHLIERGANIHLLNCQDRNALHAAAFNEANTALKVLIEKGCSPNQVVRFFCVFILVWVFTS